MAKRLVGECESSISKNEIVFEEDEKGKCKVAKRIVTCKNTGREATTDGPNNIKVRKTKKEDKEEYYVEFPGQDSDKKLEKVKEL